MNFSKIYTAQANLLSAHRVDVEGDISPGLHSFNIVGLADRAVEEARDRVSAALKNSGFVSPKQKNHKIVVSLAPAEIKKFGTTFDLPIALAYLHATKQISFDPRGKIFVGELSLDGTLQKMRGVLPIILFAKKNGFGEVFIPAENAVEASIVGGTNIYPAKNLRDVVKHLDAKNKFLINKIKKTKIVAPQENEDDVFEEIIGQENAKRALLIAAAGGHNIAMYGPPGTGKTMLAKAFKSILPPLSYKQIIECTSIHSVSGISSGELILRPPFRAPHHTSSHSAIVGGGAHLRPGEITLAHNGVLFLDEFPEFDRRTIEALRQPIEEKQISISRIHEKKTLPANFILIISMNPCPCGYFGTDIKTCTCETSSIKKYRKKMSGPIMDRIDMWVEVTNVNYGKASPPRRDTTENNETNEIREKVSATRKIQEKRFGNQALNGEMTPKEMEKFCALDEAVIKLLNNSADKLKLSVRSYHKVIKLARTIADLELSEKIKEQHILEALRYRSKY